MASLQSRNFRAAVSVNLIQAEAPPLRRRTRSQCLGDCLSIHVDPLGGFHRLDTGICQDAVLQLTLVIVPPLLISLPFLLSALIVKNPEDRRADLQFHRFSVFVLDRHKIFHIPHLPNFFCISEGEGGGDLHR